MNLRRDRWLTKLAISFLVALALVTLLASERMFNLGIVERLELASLDFRFQVRGPRLTPEQQSNVVIVEIAKESFQSLPDKWPWPRSYYARLIRNLFQAGAVAVGIDIIFVGKDVYSTTNDDELRKAIRETGIVVLAGRATIDDRTFKIVAASEDYGNAFFDVERSLGFVNVLKDPDEVVRRYVPSVDELPSFGFAILNKYYGLPPQRKPESHRDMFDLAGKQIPKYDLYSMLINYYGPNRSFRHVDFADVIDDSTFTTVDEKDADIEINSFSDPQFGYLHDGTFKGKIVLVGSTLPEDQDIHSVAISGGTYAGANTMYGVEIHANLIESVIRGDYLKRQSPMLEILTVFLLSLITFFVTSAFKSSKTSYHIIVELNGFLFAVALLAIIAFLSLRLFTDFDYVLPTISPMLAVAGGYFASTTYHFVAERRQRVMIKAMFSTYVNPSVVDELVADPAKLKLGGERKELTVLFSDLEGFTTLAEATAPDNLVGLLNEYLSAMTDIILRNNGTLDKFEGDLIMAFWGAPIPQADHAEKACLAAIQMQEALAKIREEWALQKKPSLHARVGINTGDMVVGNMGSTAKFNYTVIGDSVNLASRLEGTNKTYGTKTIISESCHRQVSGVFSCRELDLITVKGRLEPVRIYELRGTRGRTRDTGDRFIALFEAGLKAYREQHWNVAETSFREALQLELEDQPSLLFLERIRLFRANPPDPGWNGVFVLTTK
jgi:adenylate cyclase